MAQMNIILVAQSQLLICSYAKKKKQQTNTRWSLRMICAFYLLFSWINKLKFYVID